MPEYLCTIKIPTILFGSCDTSAGIILLYRRSYPLLLSDQSFMASIFVSINHTAKWGDEGTQKKIWSELWISYAEHHTNPAAFVSIYRYK
jgi:hypothetical protein